MWISVFLVIFSSFSPLECFRVDKHVSGVSTAVVCGGALEQPEGQLTSPNFPSRYPSLSRCTWTITVPDGKVIGLDFLSLEIENSYRCRYDYLLIKDGKDDSARNLGQHCGTRTVAPVMSTGNTLFVKFQSDKSGEAKGFQLKWKAMDKFKGVCGGQLTEISGSFQSPYYPYPYPTMADCIWVVTQPKDYVNLTLTFDIFDIEQDNTCRFDYVEIRDGADETARLLGRHCGRTPPPQYKSTSGQLWIKLHSDKSEPRRGFVAKWNSSPKQSPTDMSECGIGLSGTTIPNGDASLGAWPWQAAIVAAEGTGSNVCGGVLIGRNWVLTAASCFSNSLDVSKYRVKLGKLHISENDQSEQTLSIKEILPFPTWTKLSPDNNIALVRLASEATLNTHVHHVCLPSAGDVPQTGFKCVVTGWGQCGETDGSAVRLQQTQVTIVSEDECLKESVWSALYKRNTLCAKIDSEGEGSAAKGNIGGPVVCTSGSKWKVLGLAGSCPTGQKAGIFASVQKYSEWILFLSGVNVTRNPPDHKETPPPLPNPFPTGDPPLPPPPPPPPLPQMK